MGNLSHTGAALVVVVLVTICLAGHEAEAYRDGYYYGGYYGRSDTYNRTCSNETNYYNGHQMCSHNEKCDSTTNTCVCTDDSRYDAYERNCRDLYCFEMCRVPGYECHDGQCQLCWTNDGQYLCDRPERVYIPVAIAVAVTFVTLVSLYILVKLSCCCRRWCRTNPIGTFVHKYQPLFLPESAARRERQFYKPDPVASTNPFATAWVEQQQVRQHVTPTPTISTQVNVQHSMNLTGGLEEHQAAAAAPQAAKSDTVEMPPAYTTLKNGPDASEC